jgi:hypothetical protein
MLCSGDTTDFESTITPRQIGTVPDDLAQIRGSTVFFTTSTEKYVNNCYIVLITYDMIFSAIA